MTMSNNIQKLQIEERIRILCLKHGGQIEAIAKEGNVQQTLFVRL